LVPLGLFFYLVKNRTWTGPTILGGIFSKDCYLGGLLVPNFLIQFYCDLQLKTVSPGIITGGPSPSW